jgi:WD40 repeat protein
MASGGDVRTKELDLKGDSVSCMCSATFGETAAVVLGTSNGQIHVLEADTLEVLANWKPCHRITAITSGSVQNSRMLFVAGDLEEVGRKGDYVVSAWSLPSLTEKLWPSEKWMSDSRLRIHGYSDKELRSVVIGGRPNEPVLYAAGPYLTVAGWKLGPDCERIGTFQGGRGGNQWFTATSVGEFVGRHILAAGSDDGTLAIWDAESQEVLAERFQAHDGEISALVFLNEKGLVSSGVDGKLKLWNAEWRQIAEFQIEHGAVALIALEGEKHKILVATSIGLLAIELGV